MNIQSIYQCFLECTTVTTDSRETPKDALFVGLKGEHFNGNKYAKEALLRGCKYAIIDEAKYAEDDRFLLVDNALSTLQKLAHYHRSQMNLKVIGITGSNGKTTTKELIHKVLNKKYTTLATKKNFNNHIGLPLTLLELTQEHEFAIIEMGANHLYEIKQLCEIADPDFGLITNIGKAHLEGFGSYENIIKAKSELYDHVCSKNGIVFYNATNELLLKLTQERNCQTYSYGDAPMASCPGKITGTTPFLEVTTENTPIKTQITGKYNFENIMAGICLGKFFQVPLHDIATAIYNYIPENNRSQVIHTTTNEIILDAYNANPTSMVMALENFAELQREKKVAILGDMFELGAYSENEHQNIIDRLDHLNFDEVFLVGNEFSKIFPKTYSTFPDTEQIIAYLKQNPVKNSSVLIKGSRGMALEKIAPLL